MALFGLRFLSPAARSVFQIAENVVMETHQTKFFTKLTVFLALFFKRSRRCFDFAGKKSCSIKRRCPADAKLAVDAIHLQLNTKFLVDRIRDVDKARLPGGGQSFNETRKHFRISARSCRFLQ